MSAIIKACQTSGTLKNTGSQCVDTMGPTAMIIAVPKTLKWTATDMLDFTTFLTTKIHAAKNARVYPMFGPSIPIRKITNSKEADVVAVQEDGTPIFIRYGILTRQFATTEAGLCHADALQSFNKSGYSYIEVDNTGRMLFRDNGDGTFSGLLTTFMYSPSPDLPDFKNPMYVNFQISITPQEFVQNGVVYQAQDSSITNLIGLFDSKVTDATGSTTTKLKIGVFTTCSLTDLVALFGAPLAAVGNFVVTKDSDGSTPTITAAAIVSDHIELTGTFVSGSKYTVALAAPSVLLAALLPGYEGVVAADILIP